jgi:hypothetical protein
VTAQSPLVPSAIPSHRSSPCSTSGVRSSGAKDDAIWAWLLVPQGRPTRLVTRLRTGPILHRPVDALVSAVLLEVGDFPMMRKMLIGIWERAESSGVTVRGHGYAA